MKNNKDISLYIFHTDNLSEKNLDKIRNLADKFSNEVYNVKSQIDDIGDLPNKEWPIEAWLRHMALSLLPSDMERILYLDGDIIVNDSIYAFYSMDMKNYCYAAAMDRPINGKCGINRDENRLAQLGMHKKNTYVNAGVLLINLSKIRELRYKQEDFWVYARNHMDVLIFPDQDLLNGMFAEKILVCDENIYNFQINTYSFEEAKEYLENARIIHYTSFRPWDLGYKRVKAGMIWWKYAKQVEVKFIRKYIIWGVVTLFAVVPWHFVRIIKNIVVSIIKIIF